MPGPAQLPPARGLHAITGAMSLVVILLVIQIWLLTATLDAYLAGRHSAALPAAIISGVIFTGCVSLYLFVERIDRKNREVR